MHLSDVELFCEIHAAGSLSAAGRKIGLSPMAVSRRLVALELELGVRLLHRTTRSISTTADGETFLPMAKAMIEARNAAFAAFAERDEGLSGVLRVTAPNRIGRALVVPLVVRLMAENPLLHVDLFFTDEIIDIVASGVDVALRVAPLQASELVAVKLSDNPRILCASPEYLTAFGAPERLEDIGQHMCLTHQAMPSWPFLQARRKTSRKIDSRLAANGIDLVHEACVAGGGLALLSYWDVWQQLEQGTLVAVTLKDAEPDPLAIWAVLPTKQQLPERVRVFIDKLKNYLKKERSL